MAALVAVFVTLGNVQQSVDFLLPGTLIACALVVAIQLPITLPLERDASDRARKLVRENGLLAEHEQLAFDRLLNAAWKTHAASEAQRWVVIGLLAVVVGCFPLFQPLLNPSLDEISTDEAIARQTASVQPAELAHDPVVDQLSLEDLEYETSDWTTLVGVFPTFASMVLLSLVALAFLGWSKKIKSKQPTREAMAILRNNEASALHASGQLEAAIAEYSKAITLNPRLTIARYNRAQSYLSAGQLEHAISDFDAAIRLAPHFLDALAARGEVRLLLGQHAGGLADLGSVRAQHPAHARALAAESNFWQRHGDFEQAISVWSEAIKVAPERGEFYCNRGLMYYFQGDQEQAISDQTTAIHLDPADAIAHNNRGAALLKLGSWAAAVEDLRAAMRLDPKLPNSFRHLAWLQATCPEKQYRDGVEAVSNAMRALELTEWKQHEWFEVLAAAYAEAGKFEHAITWQQKCLDASAPETKAKWEARLELYRNEQPFRDIPVSKLPHGADLETQH
jgi:tetratricopeptide (TPR) repeat protein